MSKGWWPRRWKDIPRQPKTNPRSYKAHGPKWRWCNTFGLVVWLRFCCIVILFRRYLNALDKFEGDSNWVRKRMKSTFSQKKNHPIRSPDDGVLGVLNQVCLCSPNLNPERERLELYLLLAQKWRERTFWTTPKLLFSLIFICKLYKCPIHLQLDMAQKFVKYFCPGWHK